MSSIKLQNDCIFYYGNPAGYVEKDTAIVDFMFKNDEFENWIKLSVYDKLKVPQILDLMMPWNELVQKSCKS